jgi:hypothetical protein
MCQGWRVFDDKRPASGDGFMRCSDGHVRWGIYGAAGVVFVIRETDGPRVMVQKRSQMAHEGGTWSCAGGALDQGEMPLEGALREASEEVGDIVGTPRQSWSKSTHGSDHRSTSKPTPSTGVHLPKSKHFRYMLASRQPGLNSKPSSPPEIFEEPTRRAGGDNRRRCRCALSR